MTSLPIPNNSSASLPGTGTFHRAPNLQTSEPNLRLVPPPAVRAPFIPPPTSPPPLKQLSRDDIEELRPVVQASGPLLACAHLVHTLQNTGGVDHDPATGYYRPVAEPDWIDLGQAFHLAVEALDNRLGVSTEHDLWPLIRHEF